MSNTTQENKDSVSVQGVHLFEFYDTTSKHAHAIECAIESLMQTRTMWSDEEYNNRYAVLIQQLRAFKTREVLHKNLVPTVGRALLAQRLIGVYTYTGTINYGALGTGTATPANANTQLATEVFRKVSATVSVSGNVSTFQFFFTKADTNGTYQEWGAFIDGTASANTGQIFSRLLTGGWTKSSSETMTVLSTYTFS